MLAGMEWLSDLSPYMQQQVQRCCYEAAILSHPFFQMLLATHGDSFSAVCMSSESAVYAPGDVISVERVRSGNVNYDCRWYSADDGPLAKYYWSNRLEKRESGRASERESVSRIATNARQTVVGAVELEGVHLYFLTAGRVRTCHPL